MLEDFNLEQLQLFTQLTTNIDISPFFSQEQIYLMSGEIRQIKSNKTMTVPLWLAILLKKQQKCKISMPAWMEEKWLQQAYNDQSTKSDLNYLQINEFFQISYMILNYASDDLKNPTKIRNLIDSLRDLRQKIILKKLNNRNGFLINNVTTYEINKFRKAKNMIIEEMSGLQNLKPSDGK